MTKINLLKLTKMKLLKLQKWI